MHALDEARAKRIANEILCYIRANPRSKDSLDGIRTFWLSAGHADAPRAAVLFAIEQLVKGRVLNRDELPDGGVIYGAAQRHQGPQR